MEMKKWIKMVKVLLAKMILANKSWPAEDAILIFAEVRGGSTWLAEMLNLIPQSIIQWEPLNREKGLIPPEFNWGWRPKPELQHENVVQKRWFAEILSFRRYNFWTLKTIPIYTFPKLRSAEQVIVKFVRANKMIPWILHNFNLKHKPILLLRHPIATSWSHVETFGHDSTALFLNGNFNNHSEYDKHSQFIMNLDNPLQKQLAIWCINNIECFENNEVQRNCIMVYYEDLIRFPEREMARIMNDLGFPNLRIVDIPFKKASITDYNKTFLSDVEAQLNKWKSKISETELIKLQEILDYFGIKRYSAFSVLPNRSINDNGLAKCSSPA